jgi:hypothetical protein
MQRVKNMDQTIGNNTEIDFNLNIWDSSYTIGTSYFEEHTESYLVATKSIHFDKLYQARSSMYYKQVNTYATAMKNGHKFPPVRLARIDDKKSLTVIDGWHRLSAATSLGVDAVPAIVERMSCREAMRQAALANLGHGLPLKKAELRRVFKLFIKSGSYRKKNKQLMSYREISTALNGCVGHTTIVNWMKKDFPKIANAMGGVEHGNSKAELPRVDVQAIYFGQSAEAIESAFINFKELTHPMDRYRLYELASNMISEMNQFTMVAPEPPEMPEF